MKSGAQSSTTLRAHRFPVSRSATPAVRSRALVPLNTATVSPTSKGNTSLNDFHRVVSPRGTGTSVTGFPSIGVSVSSAAEPLGIQSNTTSPNTALGGHFPLKRTGSQYSLLPQSSQHFSPSPSTVFPANGSISDSTAAMVGGSSYGYSRRLPYSPSGVIGNTAALVSSPALTGGVIGSHSGGTGSTLLPSGTSASYEVRARSPFEINAEAVVTVVAPVPGASVVRDQQEAMWRAAEAEENANTDRVQVKVEGFFEQDEMGGLIPSEMPRSRVLYVLTASEGRDMIFKTIQYTLLIMICLLKRPSLFSPDATAFLDMWALRFWNNYNTIRHGRSLFKLGSWILNLFQAQIAVERLAFAHKRLLLRVLRSFTRVFCLPFAKALGIHISRRFYLSEEEEEEDIRRRKLYNAAFGQLSTPVMLEGSGASQQQKKFPLIAPPKKGDYVDRFSSSIFDEATSDGILNNANTNDDSSSAFLDWKRGLSFSPAEYAMEVSTGSILRSELELYSKNELGHPENGKEPQKERSDTDKSVMGHPLHTSREARNPPSQLEKGTPDLRYSQYTSCLASNLQKPMMEITNFRDTRRNTTFSGDGEMKAEETHKDVSPSRAFTNKMMQGFPSMQGEPRRRRSSVSEVDDMLLGGVYAYVSDVERPSGVHFPAWKGSSSTVSGGITDSPPSSVVQPYTESTENDSRSRSFSPLVSATLTKGTESRASAILSASVCRAAGEKDANEESMLRLRYADVGGDEVQLLAGEEKQKPGCISDSEKGMVLPSYGRPAYSYSGKKDDAKMKIKKMREEELKGEGGGEFYSSSLPSHNTSEAEETMQRVSGDTSKEGRSKEDAISEGIKSPTNGKEETNTTGTDLPKRETTNMEKHATSEFNKSPVSSSPIVLPSEVNPLPSQVGRTLVVSPPPPLAQGKGIAKATVEEPYAPATPPPSFSPFQHSSMSLGVEDTEKEGDAIKGMNTLRSSEGNRSHASLIAYYREDEDTPSLTGSFAGASGDSMAAKVVASGLMSFWNNTHPMLNPTTSDNAPNNDSTTGDLRKEVSLSDVLRSSHYNNSFPSQKEDDDGELDRGEEDGSPFPEDTPTKTRLPSARYLEETLPPSVRRPPARREEPSSGEWTSVEKDITASPPFSYSSTEGGANKEASKRKRNVEEVTSKHSEVSTGSGSSRTSTEDEDEALLFQPTTISALSAVPSTGPSPPATHHTPATIAEREVEKAKQKVEETATADGRVSTSNAISSSLMPPASDYLDTPSPLSAPAHPRRPKPRPAPILDHHFIPLPPPEVLEDSEWDHTTTTAAPLVDLLPAVDHPLADPIATPHLTEPEGGPATACRTTAIHGLPARSGGGLLPYTSGSTHADPTHCERTDVASPPKKYDHNNDRLTPEEVTVAVLEASRRLDGPFSCRKSLNDPLKDGGRPSKHYLTAEEASLGASQRHPTRAVALLSSGGHDDGKVGRNAVADPNPFNASLPSVPSAKCSEERQKESILPPLGEREKEGEESTTGEALFYLKSGSMADTSALSSSSSTSELRRIASPAAVARPAQCRQSPLQFRKALMALFLIRCLAAAVRHFLRDATLLSSERFFFFPRVERHRHGIHNAINIFWFVSATIDLILSTTRVFRKGWLKYASSRQNIYCRCACKREEDPADFICRVQGMVARRKTDLFFPPLDLDYGAPATSNIGFFEAADPVTMRPACSRCGCIYDIPVQHVYASENPARQTDVKESSRSKSAAEAAAAAVAQAAANEASISGDCLTNISNTKVFTPVEKIPTPTKIVHPLPLHTSVKRSSSSAVRSMSASSGLAMNSSQSGTPKSSLPPSKSPLDKLLGKPFGSGRQDASSGRRGVPSAGHDGVALEKRGEVDEAIKASVESLSSGMIEIDAFGLEGAVPHSKAQNTNVEEDGGLLLVPWMMRRLFNYAWLTVVHENFSSTLLMHLNYMAQWYLACQYTFGNFETHRRDSPLKDVLHLDGAVAGLASALVVLFRVIKSAPS